MTAHVTLYTRRNCSLCEKAKEAIRSAEALSGAAMELEEIDIDSDPDLQRRFTNDVPVIYVDGTKAFRHRVDPAQLAELLRQGGAGGSPLAEEPCVPCRGGVPPLKGDDLLELQRDLGGDWRVLEEHHLEKEFGFPDFAQALAFTNRIGAVAEKEGHHPDILLGWGKVRVTLWTHKIDGLTRSDFVLAAKIDRVH